MATTEDEQAPRTGLAERAGPVRSWLVGFFRRRVREEAEVEDMVQDVFLRIAARDSTEPIEHLDGYVLRIATNVLADRARYRASRRTHLHVLFDQDAHGDVAPDPARILAGKQDLQAATLALLSLPERTRTIFVLRRLEGCPVRDIATQLGVSVSAVEKHLIRAVRHLSAEMGKPNGA
jgi:RNA polymerase sigma-70 factor (ECF subfamily)